MATLDLRSWNLMQAEILARIFSFLPLGDRHNISHVCRLWATAVSYASVWSFTEVHCDLGETEEEEDRDPSGTLLEKIQPYMGHILYLKLVLDMSLGLNWRMACTILDVMSWNRCKLQGLQIVCYGKTPIFCSGQDLLDSLRGLFQGMDEATMQHIDFYRMPLTLSNRLVLHVGSCSPNLRTLLMNNRVPGLAMLKTETIVEVLRSCPKLSSLGVPYVVLSRRMFQELLDPNRELFKYLDLFYDGLDNDVTEDCWISARERHPSFRVGLDFAASVTTQKMAQILKPHLPISQLRFSVFTNVPNQNGTSFHVFDQGRFAKEVLPKYFKHNNMASFVRQLNMYGFRKVVNIEQGGLVKPERDDTEFQHLYFLQGHEHLLEHIKRKVSVVKSEETKMRQEDLSRLLYEIQVLRNQQKTMECQVEDMKQQNEVLWREVVGLRQNHSQHQKVINKLIQFLFGQLQPNPSSAGIKRKIPLMLDDGTSAPQMSKYRRHVSVEPLHHSYFIQSPPAEPASCINASPAVPGGPIISDVTEASQSNTVVIQPPSDTERLEMSDSLESADLTLEGLQILLRNQQYNLESTDPLDVFSPSISASEWNLNDVEANLSSFVFVSQDGEPSGGSGEECK